MFAVYAGTINPDDPLSGLVVGEQPEPEVRRRVEQVVDGVPGRALG